MLHTRHPLPARAAAAFIVMFIGLDTASAVDFSVGPAEVIYSKSQRKSAGGSNWVDGSFGVVANSNGTFDFYGANSSKSVLTTGTLTNPGATKQTVSIYGIPKKTFSYVAGGPVYR